jgi:tetratricopeptide (TPR) repeat protein
LTNTAFQSRLLLFVEAYLLQQGERGRTLLQQLVEPSAGDTASSPPHTYVAAIDRLWTRGVIGIQQFYIHLRYAGQPTRQTLWLQHTAAEAAYYLGEPALALPRYTQLLKQAPDFFPARQRAFEICYEQGDFRHALQHFRRLVPQNAPAAALSAWQSLVLGELLYQQGHYHEATTYLTRAATLRLRDYKLFYYLGLCHLRAGALREARHQFGQALRLLHPGITAMRLDEMARVYHSLPPDHGLHRP